MVPAAHTLTRAVIPTFEIPQCREKASTKTFYLVLSGAEIVKLLVGAFNKEKVHSRNILRAL